jgi:hypothetical protein
MKVVDAPAMPHRLHGDGPSWRETNCYTDVWIELLHALGHEPLAMLGPCLRVRLEADQWTFFKPSFDDLHTLYGIDVVEANPWRGLLETCRGAVASGRIAIPEVDSWFLPDTAGVAYQLAHVKSSIAVLGLDVATRHLSYAHNAGCHTLEGDDFDGVFGLGAHERDDTHLPSYVDMCTPPVSPPVSAPTTALADVALAILKRDLHRLPALNPFTEWAERFDGELATVRTQSIHDPTAFHAYAFSTFRQFGPAFELAAAHVRWVADHARGSHPTALATAATEFESIASTALIFQMRTARAVIGNRPLDADTWLSPLATAWHTGVGALASLA